MAKNFPLFVKNSQPPSSNLVYGDLMRSCASPKRPQTSQHVDKAPQQCRILDSHGELASTNVPDVDEYTIAAMEMSAQNARQRDAGHMADAMARWLASNAVCTLVIL